MNELFRFVALRPAKPTAPDTAVPVTVPADLGEIINSTRSTSERVRLLANRRTATDIRGYKYGSEMQELGEWASAANRDLTEATTSEKLLELTGQNAKDITASKWFKMDVEALDDTLVTIKYRSAAPQTEVVVLCHARTGYDVVSQLARDQVPKVRNLVLTNVAVSYTPPPIQREPRDPPRGDNTDTRIRNIADARQVLLDAIRTGFKPIESSARGPATGSWYLNEAAIGKIPEGSLSTIRLLAGDPRVTPATTLSARLDDAYASLLQEKTKLNYVTSMPLRSIGTNLYSSGIQNSELVVPWKDGEIGYPGNIRPVGIGDLLIVREHTKRYEGGELGHIENVLQTEKLERSTRRLDRSEQTTTIETENSKEEERDTQSTDRFSLKRETDDTIKNDAQVKAGLSVDAKYGPFVEVKADLQGSYQNQTEDTTKQATEFSKDIVARSASKVASKVRQLKTVITITEWEEKYNHSFDNATPNNISGVYQFVDKVSTAQVYNYGKRLMFDVIVPEPAAFYIWAQQNNSAEAAGATKPEVLAIKPSDLDVGNYQIYAQAYGATGIDPPPSRYRVISKSWDFNPTGASEHYVRSKSDTITIDDGYTALSATVSAGYVTSGRATQPLVLYVVVGNQVIDVDVRQRNSRIDPVMLSSEEGTMYVCIMTQEIVAAAIALEVLCEMTNRAFEAWQEKAYAAIYQAYQQRLSDYEQKLANLQTSQAVGVTERNPDADTYVITSELRKACIEQLTTQHFDLFGATGQDTNHRPEIDFGRLAEQGPFLRFFENAFEWEHIVYYFYPYFWASKSTWKQRSLLDDSNNPDFANFLRAGAARVVFPVRPGFDAAVVHYLDTGLIWNGGNPPDISSSLYLPIVQEIGESEQQPGNEVPIGKSWNVRVPTQLVKLRTDNKLPRWKEDADGEWVPDDS